MNIIANLTQVDLDTLEVSADELAQGLEQALSAFEVDSGRIYMDRVHVDVRVDEDEKPPLTPRELGAVLAGLRTLQQVRAACGGDLTEDLHAVLTDDGTFEALDDEEIDELCERLNT